MVGQHFRAGVVAVVRHPDGCRVLVFERGDTPGAWQFPQGGLDHGETPEQAVWRELAEETGLTSTEVTLVDEHAEWLSYTWPDGVAGRPGRIGQTLRWFLFDARTESLVPNPDGREFTAWRWVMPSWIVDHVVDWRRGSYTRALGIWFPG